MTSRDLAVSDKSAGKGLARGGGAGHTPPPDPGQGSSIHAVEFGTPGLVYEHDIPKTFRKGAAKEAAATALALREKKGAGGALVLRDKDAKPTPVRSAQETAKIDSQTIASGARQLDKARRSGSRVVLRRVGWQATPTLIVITTAERELRKTDDNKYKPEGDWLVEYRKTYRNLSGAAEKRVGTVNMDEADRPTVTAATPGDQQGTPPASSPATSPKADPEVAQFPEGTFAMSFLPRAVRSSLRGHVPTPVVFDGTVLQFSDPGTGTVNRQEVNVIRMDEKKAIVVQAKRKPDGKHWEVSQATYTLGEPEIEQV